MTPMGAPAPYDIFTDHLRWGDIDDWNRTALALHERGGIHHIQREGFEPFWAVIDHAAVMDIERHHDLFTNSPFHILVPTSEMAASREGIVTLVRADEPYHGARNVSNASFSVMRTPSMAVEVRS